MGGFIGIVMLGMFASRAINPGGADGLFSGGSSFFFKQCAAVLLSSVWAFVFTLGMLWLINRVTPVRVEESDEQAGLDEALHGEKAYLETA